MLFRLRGLVALDVADHVVPPLLGLTAALIADLVQDVVEVADGIEDLPDVRLLNPRDGGYPKGMRFDAASGSVRVAVDAIGIVLAVERMIRPWIASACLPLNTPAVE